MDYIERSKSIKHTLKMHDEQIVKDLLNTLRSLRVERKHSNGGPFLVDFVVAPPLG